MRATMRDRALEVEVYPRQRIDPAALGRTLCIAPHPDDEVLGCGGLLALLAADGLALPSLVLTRGEAALAGADSEIRAKESHEAARRLGMPAPKVLDLGDRKLRYEQALVDAFIDAIEQSQAQTVLVPSLSEPHPDHQACAIAALDAGLRLQARRGSLKRILFYEDGAPMHPNALVVIDEVADLKWFAIEAFGSQLSLESYAPMAKALASLRAFGAGLNPKTAQAVRFAEAFFDVDLKAYATQGPLAALPQWPWVRSSLRLANRPESLPMLCVLMRSMNRPCLLEAIASVCAQSYRPIMVILANASGQEHQELSSYLSPIPLQMIAPAMGGTWTRSQAANALLEAACLLDNAAYALFLDDDDLLDPNHLMRLVDRLTDEPRAVGAYAGVRVVGPSGEDRGHYDVAWSAERLNGINFIPIHAMAFRLDAIKRASIRFDESLPVLEDWDFWRRLATQGLVIHCQGVSATYRQGLGDSQLSNPSHPHYWRHWHRVLIEQSVKTSNTDALAQTLAWHALALEESRIALLRLDGIEATREQQARQLLEARDQRQDLVQKNDALEAALKHAHETFHAQLAVEQSEKARRLADHEKLFAEQALAYERELALANAKLHTEAQAVVSLQAKLQEISVLAQVNFQQASEAQAAHAQSQHELKILKEQLATSEALTRELQASEQSLGALRDALQARLSLIESSRGWAFLCWLRGLIRRD